MTSHRLSRLRALFNRLQHQPSPEIRPAFLHPLVLRLPSSSPPRTPSKEYIERLGYLFSVNGSFFCSGGKYGASVYSSNPEIPSYFFVNFGGKLQRNRGGIGGVRPNYRWYTEESHASKLGKELKPFCARKRVCLEILENLDVNRNIDRIEALMAAQKSLHFSFFPSSRIDSWRAFSELVDSHGHVLFDQATESIRLRVPHQNRELLESVSALLAREGLRFPRSPRVIRGSRGNKGERTFFFMLQGQKVLKHVLEKLVEEGLFVKRKKAEAALRLLEGKKRSLEDLISKDAVLSPGLPASSNHCTKRKLNLKAVQISRIILRLKYSSKPSKASHFHGNTRSLPYLPSSDNSVLELAKLKEKFELRFQLANMRVSIRSLLLEGGKLKRSAK